ncbi:progestin and adipoQ receptor family member 3-like [Branchiostoma lanceolatum]|uniref:progestin and adipoQ receptor family member 3-like n=1 Tax=Branchiostoma lanceolatum TaxID=7740 RepID=UPI003451AB2D
MSQSRKGRRLQLYTYEQLPKWYQEMESPYITAGYRNNLSYQQCSRSIFQIHNETGNIWTHLLPAILFLPLALYDVAVIVPGLHGKLTDYVTMAIFHFDNQITLLASAYFHTFLAQGCKQNYEQCLAVDLWGVAMATAGNALIYVAYAFCCSWWWQLFYYGLLGGLMTWYSVIWLHPRMVPGWVSLERRLLAFFPLWVGVLAALALHTLHHNRHWPDNLAQLLALHYWLRAVANHLVGIIVFFFAKVPERWWPGRFNTWGQSHQGFHIVVVLSQLFWRRAIISFMQMKLQTFC